MIEFILVFILVALILATVAWMGYMLSGDTEPAPEGLMPKSLGPRYDKEELTPRPYQRLIGVWLVGEL